MEAEQQFGVLGTLQLEVDGSPVAISGRRPRTLLAILLSRRGETVSADWLAEALWDGAPPPSAEGTLQAHLSRLRRLLGAPLLVTKPSGYVLEAPAEAIDSARFEAAATTWTKPGLAPEAVAFHLGQALAIWRGPAYGEFTSSTWAVPEAARLDERRLQVIECAVDARLRIGDHQALVPELQSLVHDHPLREVFWASLMTALYRCGRQAEALKAYATLRTSLIEGQGIEPSMVLQRLELDILQQADELLIIERTPGIPVEATVAPLGEPALVRFVGRENERAELAQYWAKAQIGTGGVVMVAGEPGIGKTRLVDELMARADGATVLVGRCFDRQHGAPFAPFAEALESTPESLAALVRDQLGPSVDALLGLLVPAWRGTTDPPQLGPDDQRMLVLDSTRRFFTELAVRAPLLLVLDDLQWADEGTIEMLGDLARHVSHLPLMVIGICRNSELASSAPLTVAMRRLARESSYHLIELEGIDSVAVGELVASISGHHLSTDEATTLAVRTGGNPLFVTELARAVDGIGGGSIPSTVRDLILDRVGRLAPATGLILRDASVCEGPFAFEAARHVSNLSVDAGLDAVEEAVTSGLLNFDSRPDHYVYSHALVRQALFQDINVSRRIRLSRRWAETLASMPASEPAEIAAHYHASAALGDAGAGVQFALTAADRAERAGAHHQAAASLEVAFDLLAPDDSRRTEVLMRLSIAQIWALQADRAMATAFSAAALLVAEEGEDAAVEFLARVASALGWSGADQAAETVALHGLKYTNCRPGRAWAELTLKAMDRLDYEDLTASGIMIERDERRQAAKVIARELEGQPAMDAYSQSIALAFASRQEIS